MRYARGVVGSVLTLGMAVGLVGCGGSDGPSTSGPASSTPSSTPSSASATPSTSPSPTASAPPLSRFEDLGPVKGARAWNLAYAQDVNDQDTNLTRTKALSLSTVQLGVIAAEDLKDKQIYPGPPPFTPVRIQRSGSVVKVISCARLGGWTLDRATRKPHSAVRVTGVTYDMSKVGGAWKMAAYTTFPGVDCSGVSVKGVPFPPT